MSGERGHGSAEAFARLLQRLSADGESGALAYERLRTRLIAMFNLHLPAEADALADETLERCARRIAEGVVVEQVAAYVHGIARLVLLEARQQPLQRRAPVEILDRLPAPAETLDEADDGRLALRALQACLASLGPASADLILRYYTDGRDDPGASGGDDRIRARQRLAATLGLNLNALRNRALRLRSSLEACVRQRLVTADRRDETAPFDTEST